MASLTDPSMMMAPPVVVNVHCGCDDPCHRRPRHRAIFKCGLTQDVPAGQAPPVNAGHVRRIHEVPDYMAEILTDQFETLIFQPLDSRGKPAPVDGVPQWATDTPALVSLEPSTDGLTCKVTTLSMPSPDGTSVTVQCEGDADLGPGFRSLTATKAYEIRRREAVTATLGSTGPAQDVPDTPPTSKKK